MVKNTSILAAFERMWQHVVAALGDKADKTEIDSLAAELNESLSAKSDATHNHDSAYDAKGSASSALASAQEYADSAATKIKNDLLNNAGAAYDTLKELGDLIDGNKDAIDALEEIASGKANATHSHTISDVSGLQTALDGKAASSHGTHVTYSTTAPVMDGTASVGTAATVARSDHSHPVDTSRAAQTDLDSHTDNTTVHITSTERTNWNSAKTHASSAHAPSNAEANQNAFSYVKVGDTSIAADSKTDTLTLVAGTNVTITPDTAGDSITITAQDTNTTYSAGDGISLSGTTFSNSGVRSVATGTTKGAISVNTNGATASVPVYGLGSAAYTNSSAYATAGHTHAIDSALSNSSTNPVQNKVVNEAISILQSTLDAKVPTSRTVNGKALTTNITLSASDVSAYSKTEIDNMELITADDIDTICGTTILVASASGVTF